MTGKLDTGLCTVFAPVSGLLAILELIRKQSARTLYVGHLSGNANGTVSNGGADDSCCSRI